MADDYNNENVNNGEEFDENTIIDEETEEAALNGELTSSSGGKLINVDINREMKKSFLDYSMSVITSRALPDVRDGLKPVHRRILYTMFENKLFPNTAYRKCADTVGTVLGRYHPHGDASVYDAMVRLAQDFSMRYTLVDGHGNFGSVDGDPPAAYRYTESRMSKLSLEMLRDIDEDTVDFIPNYDDRLKEPTVLPSKFPNLLVNGSTGIAVGMATNIPPHNLGEVIDAIFCLMDNPDVGLDDLMQYVKGPDFPTAGIIMGKAGIRAAYGTGRGKITLRARAEIVETKNDRFQIHITELPYQVNKAKLIVDIANLVKDKRIEGISDVNDYSNREGMSVIVDLKRDANPQVILNQLYQFTQLQISYGIIMLALVDGVPKILTLKDALKYYLDHQMDVLLRRTRFRLKKAQDRAHILEGLLKALDVIDEVIAILRASKSIQEGKEALMTRFGFDDIQATHIVQMRLGQLTGLERQKLEDEQAELALKIAEYNEILSSKEKAMSVIKEELGEIRDKYADDRLTEIQAVSGEVDIEDLIPVEDCIYTLTTMGYIKRQNVDTYRLQRRGGRGISGMTRREDDIAETMFTASSHDSLMFYTSRGRAFTLKGWQIGESSRNSKGTNIVNLLPLDPDERVTTMIPVPKEGENNYICMLTRRGLIKRMNLNDIDLTRIRRVGIRVITLREDDELLFVRHTAGSDDLFIATKDGKGLRFNEEDLRSTGRTSMGNIAIRFRGDDECVGMEPVNEDTMLLTVSETGFGRRTKAGEFALQSRGGLGKINYHTEKYGRVAAIKSVNEGEDVILISESGVIIRIPSDSISEISRTGKGVKVMNLGEGDRVVNITTLAAEQDTEEEVSADNE
ncbi:MAG: DNA gyrase subunit A [Clostridia bacterium]|nr:DNA gyrase subunit A [Clostridia bacterium]